MKRYEDHEIRLANEIAETLKDRDALPLSSLIPVNTRRATCVQS